MEQRANWNLAQWIERQIRREILKGPNRQLILINFG